MAARPAWCPETTLSTVSQGSWSSPISSEPPPPSEPPWIGKRGVVVQAIEAGSGARVHIQTHREVRPGAEVRTIEISGTSAQRQRAEDLVRRTLASVHPNARRNDPLGAVPASKRAAVEGLHSATGAGTDALSSWCWVRARVRVRG